MELTRARLIGFGHRIAYATLVSSLLWIGVSLPSEAMLTDPYGRSAWFVRLLDLPIAVATQALPCEEFALDLWFTIRGERVCPGVPAREAFFNHMRLGIPVYVLLFYVPNVLLGAVRWWQRRRSVAPAQAQ